MSGTATPPQRPDRSALHAKSESRRGQPAFCCSCR